MPNQTGLDEFFISRNGRLRDTIGPGHTDGDVETDADQNIPGSTHQIIQTAVILFRRKAIIQGNLVQNVSTLKASN